MNDSKVARIRQRPADPWETLADATLSRDQVAAKAWRQLRVRFRARWLLPLDALLLALDAKGELEEASAVQRAQLAEYAADGAR